MKHTLTRFSNTLFVPIVLSFFMFSCQKQVNEEMIAIEAALTSNNSKGHAYGTIGPEMVLLWNQAATDVVTQTLQAIPQPIPPSKESRYYAMVNIAMHDALNNIVPKYKSYALLNARDKNADPNAAVVQAAYEVIVAFYNQLNAPILMTPQSAKDYISNLRQQSLSEIPNGEAKIKGIALGHASAQAILTKRINDGSATAMFPIAQGTLPGEYRFTFPFNGPPFNNPPFTGFYDNPGWGNVTPFSMSSGDQFLPVPPDAVTSAAYTEDFNEVKSLGRFNSTVRTTEQTEIAKFWVESSPRGWNRVARNIIASKNMKAWQVARLLALLQITEADTYIGSLGAKMHYFYWRPVTAIQLAANDGNPNTSADQDWQVIGWNPGGTPDTRYFPTPPIADYPSGHSTAGGGAAELIKSFFGTDDISFSTTSASFPTTRSYTSLSEAARENSLSRIYVGYHFRKACIEGEQMGRNIGKWVYDHYLTEE